MIYEFLADGFELVEAMTPVDMLRRAGADVKTVSITSDKAVKASNGVTVIADITLSDIGDILPDMIILPGGMPGSSNLRACKRVCDLALTCFKKEIPIGAICAAPYILGELGILKGKKATCYPSFENELLGALLSEKAVERDGHVVTGAGMGASFELGCTLIEMLDSAELAEKVKMSTMVDGKKL